MDNPLSYNATLVLQAVTGGHAYGFDLMKVTHLASGTIYPLLRRLEASGLVESSWEDADKAQEEGRPARRYYEATPEGWKALVAARKRLEAQRRLFAPAGCGGTGGADA